ncbi:MAG: hypothetical protein LBG09_00450 [Puniceicoccales bacterium]|jgi:hypothetical protein|nr:hypothetical protein [Puniceicoccales bacterium]
MIVKFSAPQGYFSAALRNTSGQFSKYILEYGCKIFSSANRKVFKIFRKIYRHHSYAAQTHKFAKMAAVVAEWLDFGPLLAIFGQVGSEFL